jgi:threonine/homoserine/homoserine lactone efflux protein
MTGIRTQLPAFILGYTAILAVPGPNMLALGGLAALRGFHAAAPFALGAASGATALAVVTKAAVAVVAQSSWVIAIRGAGTLLLVVLAMRMLRSRAITDGCGRRPTLWSLRREPVSALQLVTRSLLPILPLSTPASRLLGRSGSPWRCSSPFH